MPAFPVATQADFLREADAALQEADRLEAEAAQRRDRAERFRAMLAPFPVEPAVMHARARHKGWLHRMLRGIFG